MQNTLLRLMAISVITNICTNAKRAGLYSVLADETKDCSKVEQLCIVVRYVGMDKAKINEHCLTYIEAESLNAEGLSSLILKVLSHNKLDPSGIVSQGYDGASVMSGHCPGMQQKIGEVAPMAVYIHCYAHCLNLVLVDSIKSTLEKQIFNVFMSSSKAHTMYVQQQTTLHPHKPVSQFVAPVGLASMLLLMLCAVQYIQYWQHYNP